MTLAKSARRPPAPASASASALIPADLPPDDPRPVEGARLAASAVAWLVRDTFRQAMAGRLMLLAAVLVGLGLATCLSVRVDGPRRLRPAGEIELVDASRRPLDGPGADLGRMTVGFGAVAVGNFRDVESQVRFLQALLARWAAGVAGTLILLAATAGFLPDFLRPGAASVLLSKPAPRWTLLAGKAAGVLAVVAALLGVLVVGTWLALGWRTGVWAPGYLLTWPLLVALFAGPYAASAVAAASTRHTGASFLAALACWAVCLGTNRIREATHLPAGPATHTRVSRAAIEAAYWVMPKPVDLSRMIDRAVSASDHFGGAGGPAMDGRAVAGSLGSSLAFVAAMLAIAARQLQTADE